MVLGVAHVDSQFYRNPVAEEKNENGSTQDTTDFQLFTLYPVTWVNSPIIYSILFVNTLRFSMCISMPSSNEDDFTYPSNMDTFYLHHYII